MAKAKQQAPKKEAAPRAPGTKSDQPPRLLKAYRDTITQQLTKEFDYGNVMEVPRLDKVVVNIGIGEAKDNDKALDAAVGDVQTITGQKPQLIKAKKSAQHRAAAHPRLSRGQPGRLRRARQLLAGLAGAGRVPGDRLRQDRQAARARGIDHHDREDGRRGTESADTAGNAVQEEVRGKAFWRRNHRSSAGSGTLHTQSSRCVFTIAAASAGGRALTCASSACAASASGILPPRAASLA